MRSSGRRALARSHSFVTTARPAKKMFAQRAFGTRIPCAWPVRGTIAVLDWLMSDPAVLAEAGSDCFPGNALGSTIPRAEPVAGT